MRVSFGTQDDAFGWNLIVSSFLATHCLMSTQKASGFEPSGHALFNLDPESLISFRHMRTVGM